jgi:hypothetical protein
MEVQISIEELTAILIEEYGYTIEEFFSEQDQLGDLSIFVQKSKTLLLSKDIDEPQKSLYISQRNRL